MPNHTILQTAQTAGRGTIRTHVETSGRLLAADYDQKSAQGRYCSKDARKLLINGNGHHTWKEV